MTDKHSIFDGSCPMVANMVHQTEEAVLAHTGERVTLLIVAVNAEDMTTTTFSSMPPEIQKSLLSAVVMSADTAEKMEFEVGKKETVQ